MEATGDGGLRWTATESAPNRYPEAVDGVPVLGVDAWRSLVQRAASANSLEGVLEQFLSETERERGSQVQPRLFISHQKNDAHYAERIAYLATQNGLRYWLDIHDPTLTWANGQNVPPAVKAILIAGIIEMALLNCTSVVAVHSTFSAGSKWIPYEFGRVKLHVPFTDDAAGWYEPAVQSNAAAEYFELARKTYGEKNAPMLTATPWNPWEPVTGWLGRRMGAGLSRPWCGKATQPLP